MYFDRGSVHILSQDSDGTLASTFYISPSGQGGGEVIVISGCMWNVFQSDG